MAQVLGMVRVVWRGVELAVEQGATYRKPGMQQTAVDYGRRTGHAQNYAGGRASAVVNIERGMRVEDLLSEGAGELQVHFDTGQIFVHPDAFLVDEIPTITGGEGGKAALNWAFGPGEELSA